MGRLYTKYQVYRKGTIPKIRGRSPFRLHSLQAKLLRTYSSLVRDLLRQMVPLELPKVLEIPNVVVVVVALLAPDEGVVQAFRDGFAGSHETRDIQT